MNPNDESSRRLAYHLGDLDEAGRRQLEADPNGPPVDADPEATIAGAVHAWANEPVPYEPADLSAITSEALGQLALTRKRPLRWAWTLAAATLLVFALTQARFTLAIGGFQLAWGAHPVEADPAIHAQVRALTAEQELLRAQLAAAQDRNATLERWFADTAATLAHNQQLESATRYRDVQELMRIASYGSR